MQRDPRDNLDNYMTNKDNDYKMGPLKHKMEHNQEQKTTAEEANRGVNKLENIAEIFKPRGKVLRSPILMSSQSTSGTPFGTPLRSPTGKDASDCLRNEEDKDETNTTSVKKAQVGLEISPREELITQERAAEEKSLKRCREILNKMRTALEKQKSINMDVKKGVSQLDELLDVIHHHRISWKTAEKEQRAQKTRQVLLEKQDVSTPVTSKRQAVSPAQGGNTKKHKTEEEQMGDWQTVRKKKPKKPKDAKIQKPKPKQSEEKAKIKKPKTDAFIIKPTDGHSYSEVLKNLRSRLNPEKAEVNIKAIRRTKDGSLLLQLAKGEKITETFTEAIKSTLLDTAELRELKPKTTVELRDLDSFTTNEEVTDAIKSLLKNPSADFKVHVGAPNLREQKRATITLSSEDASTLLKEERVKIGWVRCKMRICNITKRCFKCFRSGHTRFECNGPDRTNLCIKCGEPGHQIKDCKNKPKCCLCEENGFKNLEHKPGSYSCPDYKKSKNK